MTLERRLDKLEDSLSPTGLVLLWLVEAHAYGSLEAYVRSLLELDQLEMPLDRLAREAIETARAANRGKRPEVVEAAIRSALREVVFRYVLLLRINAVAHDLLDREGLIDAALEARVALAAYPEKGERRDGELIGRLRDLLLARVQELGAVGQARTSVEARYLEGHPALFPEVAAAWDEQLQRTASIADMAVRLAKQAGVPVAAASDPDALPRRVAELVADLVEPAKAEALEMLGEGRQALGIASGWVRAKLTPQTDVTTDVASPDEP